MKTILPFLLWIGALPVFAQTTISGIIKDNHNEPIPGVNIYLNDSYDGTTTGSDGTFSFESRETGHHTVIAHFIGYKDFQVEKDLKGEEISLTIALQEEYIQLSEASITSKRNFAAGDKQKTTVLKPMDIMTIGGSNADISQAIQTLPGTQKVGEQTGLFVRGGTGNETKVFIDGMMVNDFYYSGTPGVSQRGRFSPQLFKGSYFSSGGYSALYGQALSSTLILESEDLPLQSDVDVTLSSVGASAGVNLLSKDKTAAIGSTFKYTNLFPYYHMVKQQRDFDKMPEFLDGTLNFRKKTSKTGVLKFYGSYGLSSVSVMENSLDNQNINKLSGVDNQNFYTNLNYKEWLGSSLKIQSGLSYSTNQDIFHSQVFEDEPADQNQIKQLSELYQARTVLTSFIKETEFSYGGEIQVTNARNYYNNEPVSYQDTYSAVFLESRFSIFRKFKAQLGARYERSSILKKTNIAPRASVAYEFNKNSQLSASFGHFYQKPEQNLLLWQSDNLNFTKSRHYILTYQKITNSRTFRTEVFFKDYENLIKTEPDTNNSGTGYAKGVEFFWRDRKTLPQIDYWISYSYLDTKRDYLNYPKLVQPNFAANHTASVVVKKFIPDYSITTGLTYTFSSGRPYFNPNRADEEYLSDRTRSYHNLSAMVAYLKKIGKANAIFVISASNVLGNEQVFGYQYSTTDYSKRKALTPLAKRFFYVGLILNWGVDKRQQAIDDLL